MLLIRIPSHLHCGAIDMIEEECCRSYMELLISVYAYFNYLDIFHLSLHQINLVDNANVGNWPLVAFKLILYPPAAS